MHKRKVVNKSEEVNNSQTSALERLMICEMAGNCSREHLHITSMCEFKIRVHIQLICLSFLEIWNFIPLNISNLLLVESTNMKFMNGQL